MFGLVLLAAREGFAQDIIVPAAIGGVVFLLIINQLLNRWGYSLW